MKPKESLACIYGEMIDLINCRAIAKGFAVPKAKAETNMIDIMYKY